METVKELKDKVSTKFNIARKRVRYFKIEAKRFVDENPEIIFASIPIAVAAIKTGQSMVVSHRIAAERKRIDKTWYDPKTGMHWNLKRKLTNSEQGEILRRKEAGQDAYDILSSMNLLK